MNLDQLDSQQKADLNDWMELIRIPSISSDTSRISDVDRAADWLVAKFSASGLKVEKIPTKRHPMVYAETKKPEGDYVTVLVYGHYDVQPAGDESLWQSPPFEPTIREGNLYARGATDDKGQMLTHVQSACRYANEISEPKIHIKLLIEGEEEVGSANLDEMLPELADKLACDVLVISDSSQFADGQPAITLGLRGIATYELSVHGPSRDLHSGAFGGTVMNPAIALCHLMSSMIDERGRIAIEGFYDRVQPQSESEIEAWKQLPHDDETYRESVGANELFGEDGFSTNQRRWARPTFDINGLTSGHQGEGVMTVLPAKASAKFSFRLVPNQDPQAISKALQDHVQKHCPKGVRYDLKEDHGAGAMVVDADSPYVDAAEKAITKTFGVSPVLIREGGSIPIVGRFQAVLRCDCLLLGWGLDDDNLHAPDEKFRIADYFRGIEASRGLWQELESIGKAP